MVGWICTLKQSGYDHEYNGLNHTKYKGNYPNIQLPDKKESLGLVSKTIHS